ncbi:MAG: hypothetical protein Ct9H300mP1_12250 [Planctomycetaceae bacterium]|nr:MAG: hypothetical protein Ct9H300mP1_12250 [Planctomycetaceae bacterium]
MLDRGGDEMQSPVSSEALFESHGLDQPEKARATAHADVLAVVDPFLGGTVVKRSRATAQAESRFEQQGGTSLGCQPHCSRQAGQSAPDDDRWRFCAAGRRGWGWGRHHSTTVTVRDRNAPSSEAGDRDSCSNGRGVGLTWCPGNAGWLEWSEQVRRGG